MTGGPNQTSDNPSPATDPQMDSQGAALGLVVDGSLSQGVEVRLDPATSVEEVKVGTFVTIRGANNSFFGVVTDISLGSTDPRLKHTLPQVDNPFIAQVMSGTVAYGTISVLPNLIMPTAMGDGQEGPAPAKSIPPHFSRAYVASQRDVEAVFGQEDQSHFWIGSPLDMEHKLCLDLDELVKRSIGVFGKSGTGKTFLTRLILVGILQQGQASSLIFDMHSEYGWGAADPENRRFAKGLKQLFPAQVSTFTLDEESSKRRQSPFDEVVRIGYGEIEPEDVEMLRETLNLSEVAASAAFNLQQKFGQRDWMAKFLALQDRNSVFELANEIQVQPNALGSLYNRLSRLKRFDFLVESTRQDAANLEYRPTTLHYSGYLRNIAYTGSFIDVVATLLAVEWPYMDWAQQLDAAGKHPANPYYQTWIDLHTGQGMTDFVGWLRRTVDGATTTAEDRTRLQSIFRDVLRYELLFWEMAYRSEQWPE